jgi:hypothetical protein
MINLSFHLPMHDGDVLDLELKIFYFLRRFLYGLYVENFT